MEPVKSYLVFLNKGQLIPLIFTGSPNELPGQTYAVFEFLETKGRLVEIPFSVEDAARDPSFRRISLNRPLPA